MKYAGRSLPAQMYVIRRRSQRITGHRLGRLPLWHDKGNPECHHCTYIAGTTSPGGWRIP